MISNVVSYLEQIYSVWQEFNYVYEDCTQKKIFEMAGRSSKTNA